MKRLIVTLFILAVVGVLILAASGVLTFQNTPEKSRVILDKQELKEKTHTLLERSKKAGSQTLEKAGEGLQKAGEKLKDPAPNNHTPPAESPPPSSPNPPVPPSSDRDRET